MPTPHPLDVLVLASRKGGVGKTTLAGHLAVEAVRAGRTVAVIDTDGQGSLAAWYNVRTAESPAFVNATIANLPRTIKAIEAAGFDLIIIDTRGDITDEISRAIKVATLVLMPVRPSPHDLRAVGQTIALVEAIGRPLVFIVNGAPARGRITHEAVRALSRHGTVAAPVIVSRTIFAESMTDAKWPRAARRQARSGRCGPRWRGDLPGAGLRGLVPYVRSSYVRTTLYPTIYVPTEIDAAWRWPHCHQRRGQTGCDGRRRNRSRARDRSASTYSAHGQADRGPVRAFEGIGGTA